MGDNMVSRKSFLADIDPMQSGSNGSESVHKPIPLSYISDERYSVYRRTTAAKG
jgi:hypothetical protein